jgi:chemotaxis protein CheC
MLSDLTNNDVRIQALLKVIAREGIRHAAEGFSGMVGEVIATTEPEARLIPISEITALLGGPEQEAVGIYLQTRGELAGQIMLVISYDTALELADLLLGNPAGTTTSLGSMERSALQEVGSLTGSYFLNAISRRTGATTLPTPPAVMVDMLGAIIDILAAVCGGVSDYLLLVKGAFQRGERQLAVNFWMIPDPMALANFADKYGEVLNGE